LRLNFLPGAASRVRRKTRGPSRWGRGPGIAPNTSDHRGSPGRIRFSQLRLGNGRHQCAPSGLISTSTECAQNQVVMLSWVLLILWYWPTGAMNLNKLKPRWGRCQHLG
jgi:hypothetical protein